MKLNENLKNWNENCLLFVGSRENFSNNVTETLGDYEGKFK